MNGTNPGTQAAVSACVYSPTMADFQGLGEVAEWFKAAVLKTAAENIGKARKSASPAQILTEIRAFAVRSRRTSRRKSRHRRKL